MPDFDIAIEPVNSFSLLTIEPWTDPASTNPAAATRINPNPQHIHKYLRLSMVGYAMGIVAYAYLPGATAPIDAALGGRLFGWDWAEWSGDYPPMITPTVGQSSMITITIQPNVHIGHFLLRCRRKNAAGTAYTHVAIPLDVEEPGS